MVLTRFLNVLKTALLKLSDLVYKVSAAMFCLLMRRILELDSIISSFSIASMAARTVQLMCVNMGVDVAMRVCNGNGRMKMKIKMDVERIKEM